MIRELRSFLLIWSGQLVSVVGSRLSSFALGLWVYQTTGSTTEYGLLWLCMALPAILVSPLAGAFVDRHDRKRVMLVADSCAAAGTLLIAFLLWLNRLDLWVIYLATGVQAAANAFQVPAYQASIPLLVPPGQLVRANGLVQSAQATAQIAGPLLAGILVTLVSLPGVLLVDFATFLFAVAMLMWVAIPRPAAPAGPSEERGSILGEAAEGFRYVRQRPGLMGLLLIFALTNFSFGILAVVITPLVLSFATPAQLGIQMSVGGAGLLAGGILMTAWGGPRRKIHGVLGSLMAGGVFLAGHALRPSFLLVCVAGFLFFLTLPIAGAASDAIWQSKVPPALLGRCFAIQRVVSEGFLPLGFCVAGPLADRFFEPAMAPGGRLAPVFGGLVGTGAGRGIALIFLLGGLAFVVAGAAGYVVPRLRRVESELADALPASQVLSEGT